MENVNQEIGIKLIAQLIEQNPQKLKLFLIKQGIKISPFSSKDRIQEVLIIAIQDKTFLDEFSKFIFDLYKPIFSNADGDIQTFNFGSNLFSNLSQNFAPLYQTNTGTNTSTSPTNQPELSTNPIKSDSNSSGFFSGFNLNTGLDFIKDTLNSVSTIKKSDAETALLNAQIANERENALNIENKTSTTKKVIITISIIGVIGIGGYFLMKKYK